MTACLTSTSDPPTGGAESPDSSHAISQADVVDAAARVITRLGNHPTHWAAIARESGDLRCVTGLRGFEDLPMLFDATYARSAQGLNDSLLRAETAPGTALDQVAAFLVTALELRRQRGVFLSFRRSGDLPPSLQRRLNEHDASVRIRLRRLLDKGRRDGSVALRNLDSAVELVLASLQVSTIAADGPEQRMWDSELVELLLAALSEPHPPETETVRNVAVIEGSCLCGEVRFQFDGPFELMSHCHCPLCRRHHGAASAAFVCVPLSSFRWIAGKTAISTYQSSEHGTRNFCGRCGSLTPVVEADAGAVYCPRFAGMP